MCPEKCQYMYYNIYVSIVIIQRVSRTWRFRYSGLQITIIIRNLRH